MAHTISGVDDNSPPPSAYVIPVTFKFTIPTASSVAYNLEVDAGDTTHNQSGDNTWDFYIAPYNYKAYSESHPEKAGSIFNLGNSNNGVSTILLTKQNLEITASAKVTLAVVTVWLTADAGAQASGFTFSLNNYSWKNDATDPSVEVQLGTNISSNGSVDSDNASSGGLYLKCAS